MGFSGLPKLRKLVASVAVGSAGAAKWRAVGDDTVGAGVGSAGVCDTGAGIGSAGVGDTGDDTGDGAGVGVGKAGASFSATMVAII